MKDFYEVLGVDRNATDEDIKKAYKNLAKKWHPDRFSTKSEDERKEAEEKFKEISEAYNTLSDNQKRQEYDMGGMDGFNPFGDGGFDPFGGMGDFFHGFGGFGGFGAQHGPRIVKGETKHIKVEVTLGEIFNEKEKRVEYDVMRECSHCKGTGSSNPNDVTTCPHCNGTGMFSQYTQRGNMTQITQSPCPHCHATGKIVKNPCPHCNGHGVELVKETLSFKIPSGVINHPQIQFSLKGHSVQKSNGVRTENGDLVITFTLKEDKYFTLVNPNNLLHIEEVSLADALLGVSLTVKDIEGKDIKIKLDELTEPGKIFTFNGKGMKDMYGNRGVYAVRVDYKMPNKLTPDLKKALKNLK